jgi:hypothetical protein
MSEHPLLGFVDPGRDHLDKPYVSPTLSFPIENVGRRASLRYAHGLDIVRQIAIDEDWSALRLKRVNEIASRKNYRAV